MTKKTRISTFANQITAMTTQESDGMPWMKRMIGSRNPEDDVLAPAQRPSPVPTTKATARPSPTLPSVRSRFVHPSAVVTISTNRSQTSRGGGTALPPMTRDRTHQMAMNATTRTASFQSRTRRHTGVLPPPGTVDPLVSLGMQISSL
jgi:hypothetical protein